MLGFPGCALSVSAHPVLMDALPVSREHTSLETLVHILWRRMYSTSSRLALASFPHTEQLLLIVMHESLRFLLHAARCFALVLLMDNPAYLLCVFAFPLPCPHLQLLLILSQLFLNCSSSLAHPRSHSLTLVDCVSRVDPGVPVRTCAFVVQSCSNSSRVGDRSHAHVDDTWSSLVARGQTEHAQIRHRCSRSQHGHDLHNALHSGVQLGRADAYPCICCAIVCSNSSIVRTLTLTIPSPPLSHDGQTEHAQIRHRSRSRHGHDLHNAPHSGVHPSDVSTCTKWRPRATSAEVRVCRSPSSIVSVALIRACWCVPMHLFCIRAPTHLALAIVRTLTWTKHGPPLSHAARPNMHRSTTTVLVPGMPHSGVHL